MTFSIRDCESYQVKLRTHNYTTYPLPHIVCTCFLLFSSCCSFCSLPQQDHVTASHSSPGDKPPERWRNQAKEEQNTGTKRKWPCETQTYTYAPWLSTTSHISLLSRSLHTHLSAAQDNLHTIHQT